MAESITDYIANIQQYVDTKACTAISSNITVEGSTNTFHSSEGEFLCWSKGDLFIVSGTRYNDGIYRKANVADAYNLVAEAALSRYDPVSLTTENCTDRIVVINEVSAIGQGAAAFEGLKTPSSIPPNPNYAYNGSIGSGTASLDTFTASATGTTGIHGRSAFEELTASASGDQENFADVALQSLTASASGISGVRGVAELAAMTAKGTVSRSDFRGWGRAELLGLWATGTSGYAKETYWGAGNASLEPLIGGNYVDGRATFEPLTAQAYVKSEIYGRGFLGALEARGFSRGTTGFGRLEALSATATGTSGAQGVAFFEPMIATGYSGAWGRCLFEPMTATGRDTGWPDSVLGTGKMVLEPLEADGSGGPLPLPKTGDGELVFRPLKVRATGKQHHCGTGSGALGALFAVAIAVQGNVAFGAMSFAELTATATGRTGNVGRADVALEALQATATIISRDLGYPLLQHQTEGKNWSWQS